MATKTAKASSTSEKEKLSIRPLSDRVVVKPEEAQERTAGGIFLPDTAKEKPLQGRIVGVGIGQLLDSGKRAQPAVKVGDKVIYGKYAGTEIKVDGVEYTILRESDVLGIIEG
jgi:chaperonin GroES